MPLKTNINQFLRDTENQIKEEIEKQESFAKKIVLETYTGIVNLSPVDTSLFRTSNIITVNTASQEQPTTPNQSRISTGEALIRGINFQKANKIIIVNNLAYAEALESGRSSQAPSGIYGVNEEKTRAILARRITI